MSQSKPIVPVDQGQFPVFDHDFNLHYVTRCLLRWNTNIPKYIASLHLRPSISVKANGVTLIGLADSGAECSLVDFVQLMSMTPPPVLLNAHVCLFDAQNRPMDVAGLYLVEISTPYTTLKMPMYAVRGLGTQAILGWDFLRQTRATINAGDGSVSFGQAPIGQVASITSVDPEEVYLIESKENCYIPGGQTRQITGLIATPDGHQLTPGSQVYVESDPVSNLFTYETLAHVREGNCVRMLIRNNHPFDIEIKKNQLVSGITVEPCQTFKVCALTEKVLHDISDQDHGYYSDSSVKETKSVNAVKVPTKIYQLDPEKRKYLLENLDLSGVDSEFREKYIEFVIKNHDVFSRNKWDIGHATYEHKVTMIDDKPVYVPQFKLPHAYQDAVEDMVKEMLRAKVIVPARSPYNSPIFVVLKKNGSLRFVQDFRQINMHSLDDKYSIQDVRECLNSAGRECPKIFSSVDLSGAFWQMSLSKDSMPYTAFTVPHMNQQFMWTRACMGLKGCPSSFSRYMGYIFREFRGKCITYIDDALFLSKNHYDHLKLLDLAADILRKQNLKLNIKKCHFGRREVTFLGYNICEHGVSPAKDKIRAIRDLPPPSDQRQVSQYLGLFNYFRCLIRGFAMLSYPLSQLTSKLSAWKSGELPPEALQAFEQLKKAICEPPVVAFANPNKPYRLSTDAAQGDSKRAGGIGAILTQIGDDGYERLIACFSRALKPHQKRYSAYNLETLACVEALSYFDEYCRGQKTVLITDHKPIAHHGARHEKTLSELQMKMNKYDVTIEHRPGNLNGADCISRTVASVTHAGSLSDMATEQKKDPQVSAIRNYLSRKELPLEEPLRSLTAALAPKCYVKDNLVWIVEQRQGRLPKPRLFLPMSKVQSVLSNAHGNTLTGHFKLARTVERCLEEYFWCSIASDADQFIKKCRICNITSDKKAVNAKASLTPWPQSERFNARVHIDLCGPMQSATENKYVAVMTDSFSKWVELQAIPNKEAITVAEAILNTWICAHTCPHLIVTDGGREFHNKVLAELLKLLETMHHVISPHHPKAAGQVERFNFSMQTYLTAFVAPDTLDWESFLPSLKLAHNTSLNKSTCLTPYRVVYCQDPTMPWTLTDPQMTYSESWAADKYKMLLYARDLVMVNNQAAREVYKKYHDRKLKVKDLKVGDRVLVYFKNPPPGINPKLYRPWQGPYVIEKVLDLGVYVVKKLDGKKKWSIHSDRLKLMNEVEDPKNKDVALSHSDSGENESRPKSKVKTKSKNEETVSETVAVPDLPGMSRNLPLLLSTETGSDSTNLGQVQVHDIPDIPENLNVSDTFESAEEDNVVVPEPLNEVIPAEQVIPQNQQPQNNNLDNLALAVFPQNRPATRHRGVPPVQFQRGRDF